MPIPNLTDAAILHQASPESFQRGEDYYRRGAVIEICQRGQHIHAEVEGNSVEPYHIGLSFDGAGLTQVQCSCPYDYDGWCKHIVAVLLTCLRSPERIDERPSLEQLLDQLNEIQIQGLVQELVANQPSLLYQIDRFVGEITRSTSQPRSKVKRQLPLDPQPYRRQAQYLMRSTLQYWENGEEGDPLEEELPELLDQAQAFTERGDGNSALVILDAITQVCGEQWDEISDYGGEGDRLVELLDPVWAEAVLSAEFLPGEEIDIQINLEAWEEQFGGRFDLTSEALRQGWDDSYLVAVLAGDEGELWEGNPPNYAGALALIRLRILDRQGRSEEYLNLALAEGQIQEYLIRLTEMGRVEEVMELGDRLLDEQQFLSVAKVLREHGALAEALAIARLGLDLPPLENLESDWRNNRPIRGINHQCYALATWTSELAEGLGEGSTALVARILAFKANASFEDYQRIQSLAGGTWETIKPELLQHLRQLDKWAADKAKVSIFLAEGLIDEAIAAVEPYGSEFLVRQVMKVAASQRPAWVITRACSEAEKIMNRGKAEAYDVAVDWLGFARTAYMESGQQAEWSRYRSALMVTHARKRKLMNLIQQGLPE